MDMSKVIEEIDAEILRLQQAKAVLQSVGTVISTPVAQPARKTTSKRTLSPEARKAIGDAQRKRWKTAKKAAKAAAKGLHTVSAPSAVHLQ